MTKELFIETLEQLRSQKIFDDEVATNLGRAFPDAFQTNLLPKNHYIKNQLTKILLIEMNDNHENSWIEYFMYELDYGDDYSDGKATRKDGSNIDLSDSAALYDFLTEQA